MPGRRSPLPTTIPICGSRTSRAPRALAWVEAQNGATLAKFGNAALCRGPRYAGGHSGPAGQHPVRRPARPLSLQFLEGCQEPARPVAADDARQLPHGAAELGDPAGCRRAGGGGKRGLGLAWRVDAAGHARSGNPQPVARRWRCRRAARVRYPRQSLRERRILSAGGQGRHRLAGPRHAAAVQRLRRGHGDDVGLFANGPAVAARHRMSTRRRC